MTRTERVALWVAWAAAVLLLGVFVFTRSAPERPRIDPAEVRRVCSTYANLDLAELAPLCVDAGYQQQVAPEDLGR